MQYYIVLYCKLGKGSDSLYYPISRPDETSNEYNIKNLSYLKACVVEGYKFVLKGVLSLPYRHEGQVEAFARALKYNLTDLQDCFLDYFKRIELAPIASVRYLCSAILYGCPELLEKILKCISSERHPVSFRLDGHCTILNRLECKGVLSEYMQSSETDLSTTSRFQNLLHLLEPAYSDCFDEIVKQ